MSYETILFDIQDRVAVITLNRPERMNSFTLKLAAELKDALEKAENDDEVGALVITGAGRAFCAGEDVKERASKPPEPRSRKVILRPTTDVFPDILRQMPKPVIAAVNGPAVGQGLSLALAADVRIASDAARLGAIWVRRGIPPESAGAFNLVRLVGIAKACELALAGRIVEAPEALSIGLVNRVVPADQLMSATLDYAKEVAAGPPIAIGLTKKALYQALDATYAVSRQNESFALEYCFNTADRDEGIRSFVEKRPAQFRGE